MNYTDFVELLKAQPEGTFLTHAGLYPIMKKNKGRWVGPHSDRGLHEERFARILFEAHERGEPWSLS